MKPRSISVPWKGGSVNVQPRTGIQGLYCYVGNNLLYAQKMADTCSSTVQSSKVNEYCKKMGPTFLQGRCGYEQDAKLDIDHHLATSGTQTIHPAHAIQPWHTGHWGAGRAHVPASSLSHDPPVLRPFPLCR